MTKLAPVSLVLTASAAALALVLVGCGPSAAPEKTADGLSPVRLHLDWYPQTEYGGYYQAQARDLYRDAGLAVEIISGGPSVGVKQTVALGRAEIGCTDGNDVIVAIAREHSIPLVIVAAEMQKNPQGILFHTSHPVQDFEDLNGRTFMAGPGSAWVEYFQRQLNIRFNFVPLTTDLTSFLADETLVRQCFVTQEPYVAEQRGASVGTLLIDDSGYSPYRVIFTSRDYLAAHPERVRAFVAATTQGFDEFITGDPAPGLAALGTANKLMSSELMNYSLEAMKGMRLVQGDPTKGERTGLITRERIAAQIEILDSLGLLERKITVDDVAVFDFVPATQ